MSDSLDRHTLEIKPWGTFVFKRPNIGDQIEIGRRQAIALRGTSPKEVDDVTAGMAYITATLGVCIVDGPAELMEGSQVKEFTCAKMYAQEELLKIYEPFRAWVESFRPASEDGGTKKSRQAGK